MKLTDRELEHIHQRYHYMNDFALKKAVENLFDTITALKTEVAYWQGKHHEALVAREASHD